MEQTTNISWWQWGITGIVAILLVAGGVYFFTKSPDEVGPTADELKNATSSQIITGTSRLILDDQYIGNIILISTVQLAVPGLVGIYTDNGEKAGDLIGSAYFDKGVQPGKVTLSKSTEDGKNYFAVLYSDVNGDKKIDSGDTILFTKKFKATTNLPEDKG